ncbi:MAG: non-canonical purine NTP diphosphatase [Cyclobacteriaceae bacterium]|nr:non-canonical purine NTP diphosphatase [Cyclobacteriaceae bacterium]
MQLVFATNNKNKIKEVQSVLGDRIELLSLSDIGCEEELPENETTLEGNSLSKAQFVFDNYGANCFADDTGLEVSALNGAPGVYSARYSGEGANDSKNVALLLKNLEGKQNRTARFRTIFTLILDGKSYQFEGIINGEIAEKPTGDQGFGYDPIFVPENWNKSFAECSKEEKNTISHRAIATKKLIKFLLERYNS